MTVAIRGVAMVTGASSGLGLDFSKALLREGYLVYAVARRLEQMAELQALGAKTLQMDITVAADIERVVNQIQADGNTVTLLVNNAGFGSYGSMEETSLKDARYQFEVNLFGPARLTQLLLPAMRAKRNGRIINISSMGGKVYTPLASWYHATKHAIEGWSDSLRVELSTVGVDVVIIEPGLILTEFADVATGPMLQRSGAGPWAAMAQAMAKGFKAQYAPGQASAPSVITRLLLQAVRARKPHTRYVGGRLAKLSLFLRAWLTDRLFDKMVLSASK